MIIAIDIEVVLAHYLMKELQFYPLVAAAKRSVADVTG